MLDPAAHCLGASYSCWELLGQEFFSPCPTYIVLLWRLPEICWQKHSLPPKNTLQKESFFFFFFEGDNLPSCLALLFWFLGTICSTTVYAAIPVTLWVQFYQGHWEGWSSLGQAYDVGAPSRFLIPPQVCGFSRLFPAWFQPSALGRRQQTHCFVTDGPPWGSSL